MQRMQKAEDQLWQVENNAKHALPTLHGELNELRRALKLQEDVQARTLSELEAARNAHQGFRQPSSSIPISSRTTESGWECVSRDRVQAFPVGAEIRSPEVHTPSHRSPVNHEVFNFVGSSQHTTEGAAPEHLVPRADSQAPERLAQRATLDEQAPVRFPQRAASSSSSPDLQACPFPFFVLSTLFSTQYSFLKQFGLYFRFFVFCTFFVLRVPVGSV